MNRKEHYQVVTNQLFPCDFGSARVQMGCTALGLASSKGRIQVVAWLSSMDKKIRSSKATQYNDKQVSPPRGRH
jgi:hypothetical protein